MFYFFNILKNIILANKSYLNLNMSMRLTSLDNLISNDYYLIECYSYLQGLPRFYSCFSKDIIKYSEYNSLFNRCFVIDKNTNNMIFDKGYLMNLFKNPEYKKELVKMAHFQKLAYFLDEEYGFNIETDIKLWYPENFDMRRVEDFIVQPLTPVCWMWKQTLTGNKFKYIYCDEYLFLETIFSSNFSTLCRFRMIDMDEDEIKKCFVSDGELK